MKQTLMLLLLTALAAAVLAAKSPRDQQAAKIARGKLLVTVGGCTDCHTPLKMGPKGPEPDMSRYLSGHPEKAGTPRAPKLEAPWMAATAGMTAWAGPWGISYSSNLTPDKNTGLGIWTEDIFIQAMRTGRHYGVARPILPPMPWQALSTLSDEDLRAIYAYLRSVPAVVNRVPLPDEPENAQ